MNSPQERFYAVCVDPKSSTHSLYEVDLGRENPVNVQLKKLAGTPGCRVLPGTVYAGGNHVIFDNQLFLQLGQRDRHDNWRQDGISLGRTSHVAGLFLLHSEAVKAYNAQDLRLRDPRWHTQTTEVWELFKRHRRCVFY